MRKIDRILTIILVCTAIAAITSLFYSSIFAQRCRLPTIALLAWSIPLYIPPLVAIVRALYTRNRLYWDFRRRATYIAAHASRFYNNDMRRTQNSTANES
ncbi:MAG: hypothetical protein NVV74_12935 [Magnetospirillum sp.]|nr:hypothetical protein [Magnetospirillum sp.]